MHITGSIYDSVTGANIKTAVMQLVDQGGNTISYDNLTSGGYYLDIQPDAPEIFAYFNATGYNTVAVPFSVYKKLNDNDSYDITLVDEKAVTKSFLLPVGLLGLLLLAAKKKKAVGKFETKDVYPYLLIAGVLVATGALKGLLQKVGILDTPETKALNAEDQNPQSFFKAAFYKNNGGGLLDPQQIGQFILTMIQNFATGKPALVINQFEGLNSQSDVSQIAEGFLQAGGGEDLLSYLRGSLFTDHLGDTATYNLFKYISDNLPTN